ncbi:Recyclin-1 [Lachancea thermotolerans]
MEDLLKVTNIVVGIASNLTTRDYLTFQQLNKNVYYTHLVGPNDSEFWCKKLLRIGLTKALDKDEVQMMLQQGNAIDVLSKLQVFTTSTAKAVFIELHRCYQGFVDKLYHSDFKNFFPPEFSMPLAQAKIIMNLSLYAKGDINDYTYYHKVQENWGIFKELFISTAIKEMDLSFSQQDFVSAAEFVEVLLICHEENTAIDFFKSKNDFDSEVDLPQQLFPPESSETSNEVLHLTLEKIKIFLNSKIELADTLFDDKYPIILDYLESVIANSIADYLGSQVIDDLQSPGAYSTISFMPQLFKYVNDELIDGLAESKNGGPRLKEIAREFFNLYLEPKIMNYLDTTVQEFGQKIELTLLNFQKETTLKEQEQNEQIYSDLRDKASKQQQLIDQKNNFLTSFTKIFKITNNNRTAEDERLQMAYNLNVMNNNLQNIQVLVSLDLCYKVVQDCKFCIENMRTFLIINNIADVVKSKCQEVFKTLVTTLANEHFRPGFFKAIQILEQYDPNQLKNVELEFEALGSHVEPLIKFTELVNTGDIVLQMISIFYKNELIQTNIMDRNKDFLNDVVQVKKNFETMIDDYVANGLNVGINKLMDEVLFVFSSLQLPDDYNPDPTQVAKKEIKPSKAAAKNVELLRNHCFLLTGATDKGTIDIFQQEVGERFFNEIVKNIKKNLISSDGAVFLICDLNYYYDFIANVLKQKQIVPLFAGLKTVGQLYLVSGKDSKELGKMICDLGRFQGIFSQEEIYELVQRRTDWVRVRKDVEKVMYGLGVSDCIII